MTGLENILAKIDEDARTQAAAILDEARQQAEQIATQAQQQAKQQAADIVAKGEKDAADTLERARSAAQLWERKAELTAKQRLIRETIDAAAKQLRELPDEQYFSLLQDLAVAHALPQEGTLYLSPADRQRVPALFEEGLNAALGDPAAKLTLAEDTRDIDGGVVLVYGGIEENCSFTALFDDKADALQDTVQALLF